QFYKPWTAQAAGDVHLDIAVDKDSTADKIEVGVYSHRPSTGTQITLLLKDYDIPASSPDPIGVDLPNVQPGDEIHTIVAAQTPFDPKTMRVLTMVNYTRFCRSDPFTGIGYCGTPRCTPRNPSEGEGAGSSCTIEQVSGNGPSTDPLAAHPVPSAVIKQV